MNRRKHGYKFTKPLMTQECDQVRHYLQAKKLAKVRVTAESAFAEFPKKVNYHNGLDSASKHLDMAVESLETGWVDVLNDYNHQPSIRCNMGYTESEPTLTIDPKRRALNQAQLQFMITTSAEKMVENPTRLKARSHRHRETRNEKRETRNERRETINYKR